MTYRDGWLRTRFGINHAACRMGIFFWALVFALTFIAGESVAKAHTQAGNILRGIVTLDQPASGGIIMIYDGPDLIQTERDSKFHNGTFAIELNPIASALLATDDLRVKVQVDQSENGGPPGSSATLMADLHQFDPNSQVIFINPTTTVISAYREIKPGTSLDQASNQVAKSVGLAAAGSSACQSTTGSDFDNGAFISASAQQGGFDALVSAVAQQAARGNAISPSFTLGTQLDFRALFLSIAKEIANEAVGSIPYGKTLSGWVLDAIFKEDKQTPIEKDKTAAALYDLSKKLDTIIAAISQLSAQISKVADQLSKKIDFAAYQSQAQDVQKDINSLCNLESQVIQLAKSGDDDPTNITFANTLKKNIQTFAGTNLLNIWSGLEGNGTQALPGLINRWSGLVGPGPGYPIFTDNSYLKSAVPFVNYYFGAELVGLELQVEFAHTLSPSLSNTYSTDAINSFNLHYDNQMKRVAHDAGFGPMKRNYASFVLPCDDWTVDTRSGLVWMKRNVCVDALGSSD